MADVAITLGAGLFVLGELGWNQKSGNRPPADPAARTALSGLS
jgi:hypothetical protein